MPYSFFFLVCLFLCSFSYAKAAFCLEELMMTNPHNHLYCEQYAEVPVIDSLFYPLARLSLCLPGFSLTELSAVA